MNSKGWLYRHVSGYGIFCIVYSIFTIIFAVLFLISKNPEAGAKETIFITTFTSLFVVLAFVNIFHILNSQGMKIDEDSKTVILASDKKAIVDGTTLRSVIRHVTSRGRLKYVTVRFEGYGYYDIPMNEDDYRDFIDKARKMNQDFCIREFAG